MLFEAESRCAIAIYVWPKNKEINRRSSEMQTFFSPLVAGVVSRDNTTNNFNYYYFIVTMLFSQCNWKSFSFALFLKTDHGVFCFQMSNNNCLIIIFLFLYCLFFIFVGGVGGLGSQLNLKTSVVISIVLAHNFLIHWSQNLSAYIFLYEIFFTSFIINHYGTLQWCDDRSCCVQCITVNISLTIFRR